MRRGFMITSGEVVAVRSVLAEYNHRPTGPTPLQRLAGGNRRARLDTAAGPSRPNHRAPARRGRDARRPQGPIAAKNGVIYVVEGLVTPK